MTHPSPTRLSADLVEVFGNAENFLRVGKPDENFFVLPQPLVGFDEGDKFAKDLRDIGPIDLVDDHDKLLRLAAHVTVTGEQGSQSLAIKVSFRNPVTGLLAELGARNDRCINRPFKPSKPFNLTAQMVDQRFGG